LGRGYAMNGNVLAKKSPSAWVSTSLMKKKSLIYISSPVFSGTLLAKTPAKLRSTFGIRKRMNEIIHVF
jgi:hypothetical protein